MSFSTPARSFASGIGEAVAARTISRKIARKLDQPYLAEFEVPRRDDVALGAEVTAFAKSKGLVIDTYSVTYGDDKIVRGKMSVVGTSGIESWADVANRVALGNSLLDPRGAEAQKGEFAAMHHHLRQASILMSGRHLQHGDETQPTRSMEVFSNCSTSATSFKLFYLLLNGSGVGRAYDDSMIVADLSYLPITVPVIDALHKDVQSGEILALDLRSAKHLYGDKIIHVMEVEDSREGWAKALEKMELMAFQRVYRDDVLLLDFSKVRARGEPIKGMQNRPASGPGPLISAIKNVAQLRDAGMAPWRAAIYADHYLAECVLVGGARRAARMATKYWKDKTVLDFIQVKRGGFLWSSNNSVTVDERFWKAVKKAQHLIDTGVADAKSVTVPNLYLSEEEAHAKKVFDAAMECSYFDKTGEPGFINVDKLRWDDEGVEDLMDGNFAESDRYKLETETLALTSALANAWKGSDYHVITNPCVTADTWVNTESGPRQVEELIDKPFAAVVNGKSFQATGFWKTGDKPVFKVKTDRGYELRATDNHKLLVEVSRKRKGGVGVGHFTQTEWMEVKDLEPGDKLVLSNHRQAIVEGTQEEFDHGWILGEMVGDGGYNPEKYPGYVRFWGDNRDEMASRAAAIIDSGVQINKVNSTAQVACLALDKLAHGLITPAKTLLPELEKKSAKFVAGFLRGLFDADGSVQGNAEKGVSVRLWQADECRLKTVQRMLLRLGIASSIYLCREPLAERELPDGNGGKKLYLCSAGHELVVSKDNIDRFADVVGFYDEYKAARLIEALGERKRPAYAEHFTAEVISVERDGFEAVYDCTVSDVHRFCANGIIAHNCGEIVLNSLGGYCVIADVVPFHAGLTSKANALMSPFDSEWRNVEEWDDDAEDAFRVTTRALIRTNLMNALYGKEVKRTNRIGVGITGLHEYAFSRFGYGFRDLIDEEKSKDFWLMLARFKRAVQSEAESYAKELGVNVPHTNTTIKPAGCASLDTAIKTTEGVLTMRELFAKHGVTEEALRDMEDGAWIEPTVKTMVLDEGNVEREVTKLYLNGVKPVYEIEFEDGTVVKLTCNHKLKTVAGEWKRVDELTESDEILQF